LAVLLIGTINVFRIDTFGSTNHDVIDSCFIPKLAKMLAILNLFNVVFSSFKTNADTHL
jgi:hypothetical protein